MSRLDEGAIWERNLPDGRNLCVYVLLPGTGRLCLSANATSGVMLDAW